MAKPKSRQVPVVTTQVDPAEVFEAQIRDRVQTQSLGAHATGTGPVCESCAFWHRFRDEAGDVGECRCAPPSDASGPITLRGRVRRYPVTLAPTPKCPSYQAR